jgi:hypothetical protein
MLNIFLAAAEAREAKPPHRKPSPNGRVKRFCKDSDPVKRDYRPRRGEVGGQQVIKGQTSKTDDRPFSCQDRKLLSETPCRVALLRSAD